MPPASSLRLQPEEVEICKRPDGTYWQLGTGAFGTCYKGLYHGQQLVAVKVRCAAPLALLRTRSSAHRPGLTYRRPIRLSAPSLPALLTRRPHTLLLPAQVLHRVEERRRGEEFEREVALLKDLRDRNIVQVGAARQGRAAGRELRQG